MGTQFSQSDLLTVAVLGPFGGEAAQLDTYRERGRAGGRAAPRDGSGCFLDKPINVTVTQATHA